MAGVTVQHLANKVFSDSCHSMQTRSRTDNQWKLAAGDQDQAVGYVFLQQALETRAQQGPVESIMPL